MGLPDEKMEQSLKDGRIYGVRLKILILLGMVLLPGGILAIVGTTLSYLENREAVEAQLIKDGALVSMEMDAVLRNSVNALRVVAAAQHLPGVQCEISLRESISDIIPVSNVIVLDGQGSIICSAYGPPPDIQNLVHQWTALAANHPISVAGYGGQSEGLAIVSRIILNGKKTNNAAVAILLPGSLHMAMASKDLPPQSRVGIMDTDGDVIFAQDSSAVNWLPRWPQGSVSIDSSASLVPMTARDGKRRLYFVQPLMDGAAFAVFSLPPISFSDIANFSLYSGIVLPMAMWFLALAAAGVFLDRMIVRPLLRLQQVMDRYSQGDKSARVDHNMKSPRELQSLTTTFNQLADKLAAHDAHLATVLKRQDQLLREIHHRVRNNLQLISSWLHLQSAEAETDREMRIFSEIQQRVDALGLVHAELYANDDIEAVEVDHLLAEFCEATNTFLRNGGYPVRIICVSDHVIMEPDQSIRVALLISEVLYYIAKVELQAHEETEVHVTLRQDETGIVLLISASVAFSQTLLEEDKRPLSTISLVRGLVRQLGGSLESCEEGRQLKINLAGPYAF